ncbi:MAG TPA: hypothetical protein PLL20_01650 [Phycisphaerae bacterium]|nr:hypothetical protein [Phycisphaerae bacterium]HRR85895.1 hypothetical protein [Phycisphaerae bacterium]
MRNRCRKGFTLIQMVALFPLLLVILAIGLQAERRIVQAQVFESRMLSSQAMMRDVVRRFQADARFADEAVVRRGGEGIALELARGGDRIIYRCVKNRVERTEHSAGADPIRYTWDLERVLADIKHESIGDSRGVVWLLFDCQLPMGDGFYVDRHLAMAVRVGEGGAS